MQFDLCPAPHRSCLYLSCHRALIDRRPEELPLGLLIFVEQLTHQTNSYILTLSGGLPCVRIHHERSSWRQATSRPAALYEDLGEHPSGLWLVLSGLVHLGGISFSKSGIILAVLGIVTGILFFIADSSEKISTHIGSILLGVWLVAGGLVSLFHVRFFGSGVILAVIALAAGITVLITRR